MFVIRVAKLPEYELPTKIFMWLGATSSQPPYPPPAHTRTPGPPVKFHVSPVPMGSVPPTHQVHSSHESLGLAEAVADWPSVRGIYCHDTHKLLLTFLLNRKVQNSKHSNSKTTTKTLDINAFLWVPKINPLTTTKPKTTCLCDSCKSLALYRY